MQKKFSYPLKIDELNQNTYKFILAADAAECADIAEVLQVEGVENFLAELRLKLNLREHLLKVWGTVKARLLLKSVISLENFAQDYTVPFTLYFDTKATYRDIKAMGGGINAEVPDIIENGMINLADIAIEQVALQIDDYPRVPGEVFDYAAYSTEPVAEIKENPFAVLQKLKK